ncbi:MAG: hypothetical protein LBQ59_01270 [Candidatus Peribacteria bacterium]|jgi:hypothetical protein|nr:hypothetical protein [Candidatus Peribacteria bacterium]
MISISNNLYLSRDFCIFYKKIESILLFTSKSLFGSLNILSISILRSTSGHIQRNAKSQTKIP